MRRARVLWEAYVSRFEDASERHKKGRLTAEEAGELLGVSGWHFRRQCGRFALDWVEGLRDKRPGRVSSRRASETELDRMHRLYREEYADFTVKHFHEELQRHHGYKLGYTVARLSLQGAGLVQAAVHRGKQPQGACAPSAAWDDVVSRWFDASLDCRRWARSGSDRDAR